MLNYLLNHLYQANTFFLQSGMEKCIKLMLLLHVTVEDYLEDLAHLQLSLQRKKACGVVISMSYLLIFTMKSRFINSLKALSMLLIITAC